MKCLFYLFIFMQFQIVSSQNNKLLNGVWIKKTSTEDDKKKPLKYTFLNNKLYISINHSSLGLEFDIKIKDNKIFLPYFTLLIEELDEENLKVVETTQGEVINSKTPRIQFIKEELYLKNANLKNCEFYVRDLDTIYKKNDYCYVTSKNSPSNYSDTDFKTLLNKDGFLFATYVISKNGKIEDVKVLHHVNKKSDKNLKNLILSTDEKWISPKVAEKVINKQETFYFQQGMQFSNEYKEKFVNAMNYIEQNLIENAIIELGNCRDLVYDKSNIDYHLFLSFQKLGREQDAQFYKENVLKSNLAYLLE